MPAHRLLRRPTRPRLRTAALALTALGVVGAVTAPAALARVIPPVPSNPGDAYVTYVPFTPVRGGVSTVAFLVLPPGTYLVSVRDTLVNAGGGPTTLPCDFYTSPGSSLAVPGDQGGVYLPVGQKVTGSYQTAVTIIPSQGANVGAIGLECDSVVNIQASALTMTALRTATVQPQAGP